MRTSIPALLTLLAVAACTSVPEEIIPGYPAPPVACTLEAIAGITVEPIDSRTGKLVSGPTTLIIREGLYADTVRTTIGTVPLPGKISAAYERPGTYDVIVRHPGYQDFLLTGIEVTKDPCHVRPVRITAKLQPLSRK